MEYVKVAQKYDFTQVQKKKISLSNKDILLVKLDDNYYAIDNRCPHMGGSLFDGKLEGGKVICPRHGSVFDVKTGKFVQEGKLLMLKVKTEDVHSYPVKVEDEDIYIGI